MCVCECAREEKVREEHAHRQHLTEAFGNELFAAVAKVGSSAEGGGVGGGGGGGGGGGTVHLEVRSWRGAAQEEESTDQARAGRSGRFTEQVVLLLAPGPNAPLDAADCTHWAALKPQHDPGRKVGRLIYLIFRFIITLNS